jgi:hypothetical protein
MIGNSLKSDVLPNFGFIGGAGRSYSFVSHHLGEAATEKNDRRLSNGIESGMNHKHPNSENRNEAATEKKKKKKKKT